MAEYFCQVAILYDNLLLNYFCQFIVSYRDMQIQIVISAHLLYVQLFAHRVIEVQKSALMWVFPTLFSASVRHFHS